MVGTHPGLGLPGSICGCDFCYARDAAAYVAMRSMPEPETVFYDGHCGLCHGFVRFILAEDKTGKLFNFAPIEGKEFSAIRGQLPSQQLPDTLVVRTETGDLL